MKNSRHKHFTQFFTIPNLFTFLNLVLGLLSVIILVSEHNVTLAAWLIILCTVLDKLDGFFANLLNQTSDFGKELDSLSDLISFGVAPMLLFIVHFHILSSWYGYVVSLLYVCAGAFRLARFNVSNECCFLGLPITIAGGMVALLVLIHSYYELNHMSWVICGFILLLVIAMVSWVRIKKPTSKLSKENDSALG